MFQCFAGTFQQICGRKSGWLFPSIWDIEFALQIDAENSIEACFVNVDEPGCLRCRIFRSVVQKAGVIVMILACPLAVIPETFADRNPIIPDMLIARDETGICI
jgi:hypothetical protein